MSKEYNGYDQDIERLKDYMLESPANLFSVIAEFSLPRKIDDSLSRIETIAKDYRTD